MRLLLVALVLVGCGTPPCKSEKAQDACDQAARVARDCCGSHSRPGTDDVCGSNYFRSYGATDAEQLKGWCLTLSALTCAELRDPRLLDHSLHCCDTGTSVCEYTDSGGWRFAY